MRVLDLQNAKMLKLRRLLLWKQRDPEVGTGNMSKKNLQLIETQERHDDEFIVLLLDSTANVDVVLLLQTTAAKQTTTRTQRLDGVVVQEPIILAGETPNQGKRGVVRLRKSQTHIYGTRWRKEEKHFAALRRNKKRDKTGPPTKAYKRTISPGLVGIDCLMVGGRSVREWARWVRWRVDEELTKGMLGDGVVDVG
ncbi:hypothetical protein Tco_1525811 [Tanacetum coccineum]